MELFHRGSIEGIKLTEKQARQCFGQSKMPVVHETYDLEKYLWLPLCEFYDFIGRVAEIKFEGTDIADEPLPKRIEYILDGLLTLVDAERNEVRIKQVDLSESDEDY